MVLYFLRLLKTILKQHYKLTDILLNSISNVRSAEIPSPFWLGSGSWKTFFPQACSGEVVHFGMIKSSLHLLCALFVLLLHQLHLRASH